MLCRLHASRMMPESNHVRIAHLCKTRRRARKRRTRCAFHPSPARETICTLSSASAATPGHTNTTQYLIYHLSSLICHLSPRAAKQPPTDTQFINSAKSTCLRVPPSPMPTCGSSLAGCPIRATRSRSPLLRPPPPLPLPLPSSAATSLSSMPSTATFDGAHTRHLHPRATASRTRATTVVVFPVPFSPSNQTEAWKIGHSFRTWQVKTKVQRR